MADFNTSQWSQEDEYRRENYRNRPYASSGSSYDSYRPAYQYGFDAANRYKGRQWHDVEGDLSSSWENYKDRGNSTWQQMKDAVRDAWDRVTGKHTVGSHH